MELCKLFFETQYLVGCGVSIHDSLKQKKAVLRKCCLQERGFVFLETHSDINYHPIRLHI